MSDSKRKFEHIKDKFAGGIKEVAGKVTGNEQLELKGKIQASKADIKKNFNVKDKIEEIKDGIAEKINDRIDESKKKNKKKK